MRIDAVRLRGHAAELQLDERGGDLGAREACRPCELVHPACSVTQDREDSERSVRHRGRARSRLGLDPERLEHVSHGRQRSGALAQQVVRARRETARDLSWDREDVTTELEREIGRNQGAGPLACLYDHRREREAGDDPVASWKPPTTELSGFTVYLSQTRHHGDTTGAARGGDTPDQTHERTLPRTADESALISMRGRA